MCLFWVLFIDKCCNMHCCSTRVFFFITFFRVFADMAEQLKAQFEEALQKYKEIENGKSFWLPHFVYLFHIFSKIIFRPREVYKQSTTIRESIDRKHAGQISKFASVLLHLNFIANLPRFMMLWVLGVWIPGWRCKSIQAYWGLSYQARHPGGPSQRWEALGVY